MAHHPGFYAQGCHIVFTHQQAKSPLAIPELLYIILENLSGRELVKASGTNSLFYQEAKAQLIKNPAYLDKMIGSLHLNIARLSTFPDAAEESHLHRLLNDLPPYQHNYLEYISQNKQDFKKLIDGNKRILRTLGRLFRLIDSLVSTPIRLSMSASATMLIGYQFIPPACLLAMALIFVALVFFTEKENHFLNINRFSLPEKIAATQSLLHYYYLLDWCWKAVVELEIKKDNFSDEHSFNEEQANSLLKLQTYGLTPQHMQAWRPFENEVYTFYHNVVLNMLMTDHFVLPEKAIATISHISTEDLKNMIGNLEVRRSFSL